MNGRVSPLGMDWDKLRVFHAVVEAGSFTHAGELLNLSQSAISRQISTLEESLEVLLFHRHARGLIPTEQGSLLYEAVHDVFVKLAQTELKLAESKDKPEGLLIVTTPVVFGSFWLVPRMKSFLDQYSAIQMNLKLDSGELDLSMREADVAVRFVPPRQPDLIQRHLRTLHYRVYASPDYLKHNGTPRVPRDLAHHRLINCDDECGAPGGWLLAEGLATEDLLHQSVLTVNSLYGTFRAVQEGIGIAALPEYFWSEAGALVHILPEMTGPGIDVFLVYPEELRHSKRVSVFRDFIVCKLADPADL
ncbi:MAG: LysR family transcriptional regulator [Rhodospirillaceae bacterium]|nr:MAG: LysR family transcriptional regulator [Rhodospirillaceae bacterium]